MRGVALSALFASGCLLTTSLDGLSDGADPSDASDEDVVVREAGSDAAAKDADAKDAGGGLAVTKLRFYDTDRMAVATGYESLPDAITVKRSDLPTHVTLEAVTQPSVIGSLIFFMDGKNVEVENTAPYDIVGSVTQGVPKAWTVPLGTHVIAAVPYPLGDGAGDAGTSRSLTLTVNP